MVWTSRSRLLPALLLLLVAARLHTADAAARNVNTGEAVFAQTPSEAHLRLQLGASLLAALQQGGFGVACCRLAMRSALT